MRVKANKSPTRNFPRRGGVAYGYSGCINADDFLRDVNRVYHVRKQQIIPHVL